MLAPRGTCEGVSRRARSHLPLSITVAAAAAAALAGCGYSTGRLVEQPGVGTVAIAQFDNKTYRRDLEFRLTKMVAEEVRARTPWRIASTETADAVLTGTIRVSDAPVLAEQQDQAYTPILQRYHVEADCTLVERRTGRVLRSFRAVDREEFAPGTNGESLDGSATDSVLRSLSESIVHGLERPIGDPCAIPPDQQKKATPPVFSKLDPPAPPPRSPSTSPTRR